MIKLNFRSLRMFSKLSKDQSEIHGLKEKYKTTQTSFAMNKIFYQLIKRKIYFGVALFGFGIYAYNIYNICDLVNLIQLLFSKHFDWQTKELQFMAVNREYERKLSKQLVSVLLHENEVIDDPNIAKRIVNLGKEYLPNLRVFIIPHSDPVFKLFFDEILVVSKDFINEIDDQQIQLLLILENILYRKEYNRMNAHPQFTLKFSYLKYKDLQIFQSAMMLQNNLSLHEYFFNPYNKDQLLEAVNDFNQKNNFQMQELNQISTLHNLDFSRMDQILKYMTQIKNPSDISISTQYQALL